jgi:hypothetical protein
MVLPNNPNPGKQNRTEADLRDARKLRKQAEELVEWGTANALEDDSIKAAVTQHKKERRQREKALSSQQQPGNHVDEQQPGNHVDDERQHADPVDEQVKKEGFIDKVKAFFASLVAGIKSFFSGSEDIQLQSTKSNSAEPSNQQEQAKQQVAQAAKTVNSSNQQVDDKTVMEAAKGRGNKLGGLANSSGELAEGSASFAESATKLREREEARSTFPSLSGVAKAIVGFFQGKGQGPRSK